MARNTTPDMNLAKAPKQQISRFRPWLEEHGSKLLLFARQQTRSLAVSYTHLTLPTKA